MIESIGCVTKGDNSILQYKKQTYLNKYICNSSDGPYLILEDNVFISPEVFEKLSKSGGFVEKFIWCDGHSFYISEATVENSPLVLLNTTAKPADVSHLSVVLYDTNKSYKVTDKVDDDYSLICFIELLEGIS